MTDNTNDNKDGKPTLLGVPPQELVNLFGHIAEGNLTALLRLTSVCQFLDKHADTLPEDDPSRKAIRSALAGLGLAGHILCQQGKQLSDHEDKLVESCNEQGVDIEIRQTGEWASRIADDIKGAGEAWLKVGSVFRENPNLAETDADTDKPESKPRTRGGDNFGPNGQRLN